MTLLAVVIQSVLVLCWFCLWKLAVMQLIYRAKLLALHKVLCNCEYHYAISVTSLCVFIFLWQKCQTFSDDPTCIRFSVMTVHTEIAGPNVIITFHAI